MALNHHIKYSKPTQLNGTKKSKCIKSVAITPAIQNLIITDSIIEAIQFGLMLIAFFQ